MDKNYEFESERLIFRGINENDVNEIVKWRSDFSIIKYFKNPTPITRENHINWYKNNYINDFNRFDFIIFNKKSSFKIGTVGVNYIDKTNCTCEISYMIAESEYQKKGFAQESILALINKLSKENINTFYASIHEENIASIKTVEKLNFKCCKKDNNFLLYSLII